MLRNVRTTITVFIGVLQCLAVLLCCELFVNANQIENKTIFEGGNKVPHENLYIRKKNLKNARNH